MNTGEKKAMERMTRVTTIGIFVLAVTFLITGQGIAKDSNKNVDKEIAKLEKKIEKVEARIDQLVQKKAALAEVIADPATSNKREKKAEKELKKVDKQIAKLERKKEKLKDKLAELQGGPSAEIPEVQAAEDPGPVHSVKDPSVASDEGGIHPINPATSGTMTPAAEADGAVIHVSPMNPQPEIATAEEEGIHPIKDPSVASDETKEGGVIHVSPIAAPEPEAVVGDVIRSHSTKPMGAGYGYKDKPAEKKIGFGVE